MSTARKQAARNRAAREEIENSPLKISSIKDFCADKNIVEIVPVIRANINGYPYITFIDENNESENIYFSKNEAENHEEGDIIEPGFFDGLSFAFTLNADDEERVKIVGEGGNRVSLDFLLGL